MPDVSGALTRKIGPLPAWGWGVAVGGAALGVKFLRGGSGGGAAQHQVIEVPTGAPYPSPDFASDLGSRLDTLANRIDILAQSSNNNQSDDNISDNPDRHAPSTTRHTPVYTRKPSGGKVVTIAEARYLLDKLHAPLSWANLAARNAPNKVFNSPTAFRHWVRQHARKSPDYRVTDDGKVAVSK